MPRGIEVPELPKILDELERERGIPRETLIEAIEAAVLSAAKKNLGPQYELETTYNEETGRVEVRRWLTVVEEVEDEYTQISLQEAREKLDPEAEIGDELGEELDTTTIGRIAVHAAKQVIFQRIREAERQMIYQEYKDRKGQIIKGVVRRFEGPFRRVVQGREPNGSESYISKRDIIVDLGKAEAILPVEEQLPHEKFRPGDRIQALIKEVYNPNIERKDRKRTKDLPGYPTYLVVLSRTSEEFLKKLFEIEVPEIADGTVVIMSAARDPGVRAKIAVRSRDPEVDPIGACVGIKGARVQAIVQELKGEKIDIVPYSEDPAKFVCNAIAPAQVSRVIIDEEKHSMKLIVPDDQLSLAIGRKGQNVRLAGKLTEWYINISSEKEVAKKQEETLKALIEVDPELTKEMLSPLFRLGYYSLKEIADASVDDLSIIPSIGPTNAERLQLAAKKALKKRKEEREKSKESAGEKKRDRDKSSETTGKSESNGSALHSNKSGGDKSSGDTDKIDSSEDAASSDSSDSTAKSENTGADDKSDMSKSIDSVEDSDGADTSEESDGGEAAVGSELKAEERELEPEPQK